jgi:hypothetical protein
MRNKILTIALIAAISVSIFGIVGAYQADNPSQVNIENVENMNIGGATYSGSAPQDQVLGGTTNYDTLSATDLVSTDDTTVGDDLTVADIMQYGGVENDWIEGTCTDATTTVVSVVNPWSDTAYVDKFLLYISNGTSTITMTCGTSTSSGSLSAAPTDLLIDEVPMASSTAGTATTTGYYINGDDYAGTGMTSSGTNSEDVIPWKSGEYLKCYVSSSHPGAWTESTNIASCTYKIHSFK